MVSNQIFIYFTDYKTYFLEEPKSSKNVEIAEPPEEMTLNSKLVLICWVLFQERINTVFIHTVAPITAMQIVIC